MHSLRALQNLEAELMQKLSVVYGCDEEDVPVELDLLKIYNDEPDTRRAQIVSMVSCALQFYVLISFAVEWFERSAWKCCSVS
jgi:hypothetical protein